jgi:hypothetical protein
VVALNLLSLKVEPGASWYALFRALSSADTAVFRPPNDDRQLEVRPIDRSAEKNVDNIYTSISTSSALAKNPASRCPVFMCSRDG